ncbi:MAG: hypothetical protein ABTR27_13390, partial [Candidatus Competibacter phosphatis]
MVRKDSGSRAHYFLPHQVRIIICKPSFLRFLPLMQIGAPPLPANASMKIPLCLRKQGEGKSNASVPWSPIDLVDGEALGSGAPSEVDG